jgi:hypothetical protein
LAPLVPYPNGNKGTVTDSSSLLYRLESASDLVANASSHGGRVEE